MGCCCDDDEQLLQPLNPSEIQNSDQIPPSASSTTVEHDGEAVISPMNSHFSALICHDTLRAILEKLALPDLARAACVNRIWNFVASDRELQTKAFKDPWKIKDVIGDPSSGSFWRDNSLSKFAISHRIVRGDSVASLAVKYSVHVYSLSLSFSLSTCVWMLCMYLFIFIFIFILIHLKESFFIFNSRSYFAF